MASNDKNVEIKLKKKRLSFCKLFRGQPRYKDKSKEIIGWNFASNILLDKVADADDIKLIKDTMIKVRDAAWPGQNKKFAPDRKCLRDGEPVDDESGKPEPLYEGYKGCMYLVASRSVEVDENKKPIDHPVQIVDSRKGPDGKFPRLKESDGKVYSGSFNNIIVRIYAFDGKGEYPDRINASIEAVQFVAHGEKFGNSGIDADSAFDDEGPDDDDLEVSSSKKKPIDDDI